MEERLDVHSAFVSALVVDHTSRRSSAKHWQNRTFPSPVIAVGQHPPKSFDFGGCLLFRRFCAQTRARGELWSKPCRITSAFPQRYAAVFAYRTFFRIKAFQSHHIEVRFSGAFLPNYAGVICYSESCQSDLWIEIMWCG